MPSVSVLRKGDFTREDRSVLFLSWFAYVFIYLTRVNISVAIPALCVERGLTRSDMGIVVTCFFWTYAAGQMASGWLGGKLSPKWMIGGSLLLSALCNIAMAFAGSVPAMAALWALNGAAQSLMWAPMVLALARQFDGVKLTAATFSISYTTVFGYLISWSGSALIVDNLGVMWAFLLPGFASFAFFALFMLKFREPPARAAGEGSPGARGLGLSRLAGRKGLMVLVVLACMLQGFVRDSLNTWLPTIINGLDGFLRRSEIAVFLVVPLTNFAGVHLSRRVMARTGGDLFKTVFGFYGLTLLPCGALLVWMGMPPALMVACMVLLLGLMFSINPLYTSFVPLGFSELGCVSMVAGLADCAIYVGAGLSGLVTGAMLERGAMRPLAAMWLVLLGGAGALSLLLKRAWKRDRLAGACGQGALADTDG